MEGVIGGFIIFSLVIILVLLNGFFVASEFAIVKVRNTRIHELIDQGNKRANVALKIINQMDSYLSATQLGITLSSLGLGWIGEPAVSSFILPLMSKIKAPELLIQTVSIGITFTLITFLHIVIGEMAPKTLAIRQAEKVTLWTSAPLYYFHFIFKPFIYVLNGTANKILKLFKVDVIDHHHSEEEIRLLIAQSHKSGLIDKTELTLIDNIFDFNERVVREVMVPRVNMACLYKDYTFEENLAIIRDAHQTRFPYCGTDKDDIIGIVHIRDVYEKLVDAETPCLDKLSRTAISIPETMEIKDVLRNLQKKKMGMAIVVDEFGGTAGLVTTEDIIEEIFGEIQDEFDDEAPFFETNGEETIVDARLLIEEVNEYFNIEIEDLDNDTIGGWVFSRLEKVPQVDDVVTFENLRFVVKDVENRRVSRIGVRKNAQDSDASLDNHEH